MLGLLKPIKGGVEIDGQEISGWSNKQKAAYIGYIPQSHIPPFPRVPGGGPKGLVTF